MKKTIYIAVDEKEFNNKKEYQDYQEKTVKKTKWFQSIRTLNKSFNNMQDNFCVKLETKEEFIQCCNFFEIDSPNRVRKWEGPSIYIVEYVSTLGYLITSLEWEYQEQIKGANAYKENVIKTSESEFDKVPYDYFKRRLKC